MKNINYGYAQICLNGHVAYSNYNTEELPEKFCKECGDPVINKCPGCSEFIDGKKRSPFGGIQGMWIYTKDPYTIPKFCHQCGQPYPWTQRAIDQANSLIEETSLSPEEKSDFKESVGVIIRNTAGTPNAATKVRKYLQMIERGPGELIYKAFIDFSSSVAVKIITGG